MIGPKIEARLRELGMSQAELARRTLIPQTTINSLVRGNSRSTPHLIKIARELNTTPAFLVGDVADQKAELPSQWFSEDDLEVLDILCMLRPEIKNSIKGLLINIVNSERKR